MTESESGGVEESEEKRSNLIKEISSPRGATNFFLFGYDLEVA